MSATKKSESTVAKLAIPIAIVRYLQKDVLPHEPIDKRILEEYVAWTSPGRIRHKRFWTDQYGYREYQYVEGKSTRTGRRGPIMELSLKDIEELARLTEHAIAYAAMRRQYTYKQTLWTFRASLQKYGKFLNEGKPVEANAPNPTLLKRKAAYSWGVINVSLPLARFMLESSDEKWHKTAVFGKLKVELAGRGDKKRGMCALELSRKDVATLEAWLAEQAGRPSGATPPSQKSAIRMLLADVMVAKAGWDSRVDGLDDDEDEDEGLSAEVTKS